MLEKLLYQAQGGDRAALAEIVRRFQPLVLATARRLAAEGVEWLDLVQEGNLALMEAVFAFNPRGRAGFPWYARRRVYFALFNYRRDNLRLQERETLTLDLPLEEGEGHPPRPPPGGRGGARGCGPRPQPRPGAPPGPGPAPGKTAAGPKGPLLGGEGG